VDNPHIIFVAHEHVCISSNLKTIRITLVRGNIAVIQSTICSLGVNESKTLIHMF